MMRLFPGLLYEAGVHTSTPASTGREATLGVERGPAAPSYAEFLMLPKSASEGVSSGKFSSSLKVATETAEICIVCGWSHCSSRY